MSSISKKKFLPTADRGHTGQQWTNPLEDCALIREWTLEKPNI